MTDITPGVALPASIRNEGFGYHLRRFLSSPLNAIAFGLVALLLLVAVFAPVIAPYPYDQTAPLDALLPPSIDHWMGTDEVGRDVFSRAIVGARTSLSIAILTVAFGLITGALLGAVSGYAGGWIDEIIMRIVEVFMSIPGVVMALALVSVLGPSIPFLVLALSVRRITQFARLTRGSVLGLRDLDYVNACRVLGYGHTRIVVGHLLPNCVAPTVVMATTLFGNVILVESTLSFLGVGIQEPTPSWGNMIARGNEFLTFAPWLSIAPGLFLFVTMIGFNLLGDGIRDYLDPRGAGGF